MRSDQDSAVECALSLAPRFSRPIVPLPAGTLEIVEAERVVVWTDGACPQNQFRHLRRGGCGIFYHDQHPRNASFPLPGPEQTNQRAELLACIAALQAEPRPIELRSDSKYVLGGIACARSVGKGDNSDLWLELHAELARRANIDQFVKVKGHENDRDVRAGRVLPLDKWGNDGADALAVAGAGTHAVPDDVLALCKRRTQMARASQYMMLQILKARAAAEQTLRGEIVEQYGGDSGNDPWSYLDKPMNVPHPRSGVG